MRAAGLLATLSLGLTALGADRTGVPVLWEPPGNIALRDWIWGPGGEARAPKPPYQFVEEDFNGTNPKLRVRDAKGDEWVVKFGGESHSDVFGSRLLHAIGYVTGPYYFVASGVITGAHDLRRAKPFLDKDGRFRYARFKLRDHKELVRVEDRSWSWNDNPFLGTRELSGLKILMMLTSNWDCKDARDGEGSNTSVYSKPGDPAARLYYAFDDWGASMGKWGGFFGRDKWDPAGYNAQTKDFARMAGQTIKWGFTGKHGEDITTAISADDVRRLLTYLSGVTDKEIQVGLRASGASEPDIGVFARSLRARIEQLERIAAAPALRTAGPFPQEAVSPTVH